MIRRCLLIIIILFLLEACQPNLKISNNCGEYYIYGKFPLRIDTILFFDPITYQEEAWASKIYMQGVDVICQDTLGDKKRIYIGLYDGKKVLVKEEFLDRIISEGISTH